FLSLLSLLIIPTSLICSPLLFFFFFFSLPAFHLHLHLFPYTTLFRSMAVNIHITIIELNALHTKRQNLFQELDAVIHLLMEAIRSEERFSRNAETDLVCRLLLEKKTTEQHQSYS